MLYSKSYIFTLKENPNDAQILSHKLMLKAGFIKKSDLGLYIWMPLGKRILNKVINIIKQEMDKAGALEILPPFVTQGELWKESGRWDKMGKELLRFKDRHGHDFVLGPTYEEAFTQIIKETAQSYKNLPINLYQINTKFRDEIRPRYGLMRCKEFIMKDAYSFDIDDAGFEKSYQTMRDTYLKIFKRLCLNAKLVLANSGSIGGNNSEEFIVPSLIGESNIFNCICGYLANTELDNKSLYIDYFCPKCNKKLQTYTGIEVGHIFKLGKIYTEALNVKVLDKNNKGIIPICGSYGLGIGRIIAAIIEQNSNDTNIILPFSIAPYHVIIIPTYPEGELFDEAFSLYRLLQDNNIEVLLDDRKEKVVSKFRDAHLIGIPIQILIGAIWKIHKKFEIILTNRSKNHEIFYEPKENILKFINNLINYK